MRRIRGIGRGGQCGCDDGGDGGDGDRRKLPRAGRVDCTRKRSVASPFVFRLLVIKSNYGRSAAVLGRQHAQIGRTKCRATAGSPRWQWGFCEPWDRGTLNEQHRASDVGYTQDRGWPGSEDRGLLQPGSCLHWQAGRQAPVGSPWKGPWAVGGKASGLLVDVHWSVCRCVPSSMQDLALPTEANCRRAWVSANR